MKEEEEKNSVMRRRIMLLLPFNGFMIWGSLKYAANIQTIAQRWWPTYQKAKLKNLFIIATTQATLFTTLYLGGTFAILGINPITKYKEMM